MGIVTSNRIDNALYGYKTDLLDHLRDGDVPEWLHVRTHEPEMTPEEILTEQRARATNQEYGAIASFRIHGKPTPQRHRRSLSLNSTASEARPPERIRKRLEAYLDSRTHEEELGYLRPGEFFDCLVCNISIGTRGGISDVTVKALYRD